MDKRLDKYAELIIRTGINIQPGQTLLLTAPVDAAEFARLCVKKAYEAGCREVELRWRDDFITRETYLHGDDKIFDVVRPWKADMLNTLAEEGAAFLTIYSEDPEALSGVDVDRIRRASIASGKALESFREMQMSDKVQWCLVSVPNKAWAKKMFPDVSEDEAIEKQWDAIFATVRVSADNDPVAEWKTHAATLKNRVQILNDYKFKYLKYKNSAGTDLTVELPEKHFWDGGNSVSAAGITFHANMPTEEVFTAPKRDGVNGVVYATKPLVINGDIADNFHFVIKDGKIVEVHAEKGEELLKTAIATDEGASFLGEVALVPYDSPISNSGLLFYNTLFDENASCHLAFGAAYAQVEGAADMTKEERVDAGLNDSIMHEDFMVGSEDLSITGITHDGKEIPVFVDGNFAF